MLHTFATSLLCTFTHICHHAPTPPVHPYLNQPQLPVLSGHTSCSLPAVSSRLGALSLFGLLLGTQATASLSLLRGRGCSLTPSDSPPFREAPPPRVVHAMLIG